MTAGNSTPLTDGASTVLLASEEWADAHDLPKLATVLDGEAAAVDFVHGKDGLLMAPAFAVPAAAGPQRTHPGRLRLLRDPRSLRRHRAEHPGRVGGRGIRPHPARPGRRLRQHRPRQAERQRLLPRRRATRSPPPAGGSWPRSPRCCTPRARWTGGRHAGSSPSAPPAARASSQFSKHARRTG